MSEIVRNWGYVGPNTDLGDLHITQGQYMAGFPVGIMSLNAWLPKPPGYTSQACSYDFPVRYLLVQGADQKRIHGGDDNLLPALIATARQLEIDGCRMISSTCGYFGNFQAEVARCGGHSRLPLRSVPGALDPGGAAQRPENRHSLRRCPQPEIPAL